MTKHFIRVSVGLSAIAAFLMADIPDILRRIDATVAFCANLLGRSPHPHMASDVVRHPYLFLPILAFLMILGASVSWLIEYVWKRITGASGANFDDAGAWSVSIDFPPPNWLTVGNNQVAFRSGFCRFANLSTTQTRIFDVVIEVTYFDSKETILALRTDSTFIQPYRKSLEHFPNKFFERRSKFIDLPITVPPNSVVEGQVEFDTYEHQKVLENFDKIDPFNMRIAITERRAGRTINLKSGECYDARLQKVCRGKVGIPNRIWYWRWKRWKAWAQRKIISLRSAG